MIKVEKLTEHNRPLAYEQVKVKTAGNITEIQYMPRKSKGATIRKLSKFEYLDLQTGEVKEFNALENRSQDLKSVSKSLEMGRDLINTNVTDVSKCRWVTNTYGENITDPKKLLNSNKNFHKRLREKIGHYEFIACAEPQGRGAWHLHQLLIFKEKAPYIPNDLLWECWSPKGFKQREKDGKGYDYVKVKKLDDVDNVGAYLTAYLGDMELNDYISLYGKPQGSINAKDIDVEDENGNIVTKSYIKGARLKLYPPQFHIFRWSKGIKKPIIEHVTAEKARKKVSGATLTFEKTVAIRDAETDFQTTIYKAYYNLSRKQSQ